MNCFPYIHLIMASVWTTDLVSNYWKFLIQFVSNIEHSDSKISKQLIKGHELSDFIELFISHDSCDMSHIIKIRDSFERHQIECILKLDTEQTITKETVPNCSCYNNESCDDGAWSYWSKCNGQCKQTRIRNSENFGM